MTKRKRDEIAAKYGDFDTRVKRIVDAYNEWRSTGDRTQYVNVLRFEALLGVEEKLKSGRRGPNKVIAACRKLIPADKEPPPLSPLTISMITLEALRVLDNLNALGGVVFAPPKKKSGRR